MSNKITLNLICENCDSEYTVKYAKHAVASNPIYCAFCGDVIDDIRDDPDDEDLERNDDDEY